MVKTAESSATAEPKARCVPCNLEESVFQSVLLAADRLLRGEIEVLRGADLTFPQYNVLRILRGGRPDGLSCGTISERMLSRDSDLTRLLDRLDERGLVKRVRDAKDRRIVTVHISDAGLKVLRKLDGPVERVHREQLKHMKGDQLERLRELADLARGAHAE